MKGSAWDHDTLTMSSHSHKLSTTYSLGLVVGAKEKFTGRHERGGSLQMDASGVGDVIRDRGNREHSYSLHAKDLCHIMHKTPYHEQVTP